MSYSITIIIQPPPNYNIYMLDTSTNIESDVNDNSYSTEMTKT